MDCRYTFVLHVICMLHILFVHTKGFHQPYEHGGLCYWFSDRAETHHVATQACAEMRGNLAQLHSREIFDCVTRNMKEPGNEYWVGLHKVTSGYNWDDNGAPTSSQWKPREPNHSGDCVRLTYTSSGYRLADNPCSTRYNFICEKPFEPGSFVIGSGRIQNVQDAIYCPMATYRAAGRTACASACILEPSCTSFNFNSTLFSCTFYTTRYGCLLSMSEETVTLVERQCT